MSVGVVKGDMLVRKPFYVPKSLTLYMFHSERVLTTAVDFLT